MFHKRRIILLPLFLLSFFVRSQNVDIFNENFESGGFTFCLNASGQVGTNTGNNQWKINHCYNGGPGYSNTMSEDSTFGGTISFAPHSNYLHIYDIRSDSSDCNYDPSAASDRFAYICNGICTLGLDSVSFNFFYLCQGSPSAYGEVWYSLNNGPWVQTGTPQYNGKYKWQYATVSNPAFSNQPNVRFGFRWVNNSGAGKDTSGFAVDDIQIVGIYDAVHHPANFNLTVPDSVCQGSDLFVNFKLSQVLCYGQYSLDLSDAAGNFSGSSLSWVYYIGYPTDSGSIPIQIPTTTPKGNCYKVRLVRNSPAPVITGTASICFKIVGCPNTITTLQPAVTVDTNAVCAGSVIDVPFYSTGTFQGSNVYTAELSDSAGNFTPFASLGTDPSSSTYDPSVGSPPGTVSGLIPPTTPAGCHYYIRVVSSAPATTGTIWGPFCIQHCDIKTNNFKSIQACIGSCFKDPKGQNDSSLFSIHNYDSLAKYKTGNKFEIQLLAEGPSPPPMSLINNAGLGFRIDSVSGKIYIHVPCADSLAKLGIQPGAYYMRVVASNSSFSDSSLGTLVHLTIGDPADSIVVVPDKTTYCSNEVAQIIAEPWNFTSQYFWWVNGGAIPGARNPLYLNLIGLGGNVKIQAREENNGCFGPLSAPTIIKVIPPPAAYPTGPTSFCESDTGKYSAAFANNTFYKWSVPFSSNLDTANNTAKIVFDTTGVFTIEVIALNQCGVDTAFRKITVKPSPKKAPISATSPVCKGTPTLLTATGGGKYHWSNGSTSNTNMVTPLVSSTYFVTVTLGVCSVTDSVRITLLPPPVVSAGLNKNICLGDSVQLNVTGALHYSWSPALFLNADTGAAVESVPKTTLTYQAVGTDANGCKDSAKVKISIDQPIVGISPDQVIIRGQTTGLFVSGGKKWFWTPSRGLSCTACPDPAANPDSTTMYYVTVTDSLGCVATDSVKVTVDPVCGNAFIPTAFSPNGDGVNDIFYVHAVCVQTLNFELYDRWGELVFKCTDTSKGWDGTFQGKKMNAAVFFYVLNLTTTNGNSLHQKGNVTLLR